MTPWERTWRKSPRFSPSGCRGSVLPAGAGSGGGSRSRGTDGAQARLVPGTVVALPERPDDAAALGLRVVGVHGGLVDTGGLAADGDATPEIAGVGDLMDENNERPVVGVRAGRSRGPDGRDEVRERLVALGELDHEGFGLRGPVALVTGVERGEEGLEVVLTGCVVHDVLLDWSRGRRPNLWWWGRDAGRRACALLIGR